MNPDLVEAAIGLPFLKVTGGGNDFILIDNRNGRLRGDLPKFVRRLCDRGFGAGADGLILIEWSPRADLRMVYFNRDGGQADLCGNGLRCVARWAARSGAFQRRLRIETGTGLLLADGGDEPPWFTLPLGRVVPESVVLEVGGRRVEGICVRPGVPHLAVEVPDAFAAGVLDQAPLLRSHPALGPEGANVDFFTPRGSSLLDVRYYERGVEAETLSSGTGCIAAAVAAVHLGRSASPILCRTRAGIESRVTLLATSEGLEATVAGEVRILYRGEILPGMLSGPIGGGAA